MSKRLNEEYFIEKYSKVFNKYSNSEFRELINRGFLFQYDENIVKPDVLFIGINPSYEKGSIKETKGYRKDQVKSIGYFNAFHKIESQLYDEYKRLISWTHLDLCVFRETNQSFITSDLLKREGTASFIYEQLKISQELLHKIKPKLIVVSNTLARRFLGYEANNGQNVWLGYTFEFDKNLGTPRVKSKDKLNDTPVFFSSMLSGQRSLDIGSKDRLVWHINEVLNTFD